MAGKRTASSDLNHDNWDRDEEPEEAGTFQKASEDALKKRVIKTARRRNPAAFANDSATGEGGKNSVFAGFTGFAKPPAPTSTTSFGFLSSLTNKTTTEQQSKTNGSTEKISPTFFKQPENATAAATTSIDKTEKTNEYYGKLKGLNESVAKWIQKHVNENPLINLQPIFKDYEKYFDDLEKDDLKNSNNSTSGANLTKVDTSSMINFTFKKIDNVCDNTSDNKNAADPIIEKSKSGDDGIFKFKSTPAATTSSFSFGTVAPTFSFGNKATDKTALNKPSPFGNTTTPSTFGTFSSSTTPFTFGNVSKPPNTQETNNQAEEDEDEPPKVEFTPVVEEGHIYTTRCKVFVKKDDKFGDRGVGNLYLKPITDSEKVQLIVRADTNLGNLLCNFILSESIPLKRMGKKDVMLVCLPTPETKPPPVPILLRVKTPEDADKLLDVLQKHKK